MSTVNTINQVKGVVASAPLEDILEVAETVACILSIPGLPRIVKILKLATRLQDPAVKALGVSSKMVEGINEAQMEKQQADIIEQMIEIACEDGVIDADEEAFLRNKAVQIGMDPDLFMLKVRKRIH